MSSRYNSADIEVLSGLDPVKRRPGMYTDTSRPNHLAQEVVDNSIDEALAGHARTVEVTIYTDGSCEVSDDGRIGVVRDSNRQTARLGETSLQWLVVPTKVWCRQHDALVVDDARTAHADPNHRHASESDEVGQQCLGRDDCGLPLGLRDIDLGTSDHRSVKVGDDTDERPRGREIQTDEVAALTVDVEHRCGLARPRRGTSSEFDDEALLDEVADEI